MGDHFDTLETRDPEARERSQFALLPSLMKQTVDHAPGWLKHLWGHDPMSITSREALGKLPVLRKADLKAMQTPELPLAGLSTYVAKKMARLFMSPGPIYEPEAVGTDYWRAARALYAAGFRKRDILWNTFSYHLTPGGWIMDSGARTLGCAVFAAGPGQTEQQIEAIAHFRPVGYTGVPDYLKILLDKAKDAGKDASSFKKALVSGGALFPSLRKEYAERGIAVSQAYATADAGLIAYESSALEGMIVDEGVIVEIVRPGTGEPVPDGEVGEVVVTVFNRDYPMFRLATGDLSAVLKGKSPCGRTNMRIKGWMGRADQTTKVKGMFVHPEQIWAVAKRFPGLGRVRLVVTREREQDVMTLRAEAAKAEGRLAERIGEAMQAETKLKGIVELAEMGALPNDGKVISDERKYD
ncbi:MAG: phenylacetate--CoA ligase [Hyphomicrobiaceae bacterium]|nr:MAG: phenylacetate--CoA ligase [Hyphomicrobiaceae bacterium]